MSSARVQSIEALNELKLALLRFKSSASAALDATQIEARRTRALLDERLRRWQNELQRRLNQLKEAEQAYRTCLDSARYDPATGRSYQPDCSSFAVAVRTAKRRVEEAQQHIRQIQIQIRAVEDAWTRYQRQAAQFLQILDTELSKASTQLSNQVAILSDYATGLSGGMTRGIGVGSMSAPLFPVNSKGHPYPTIPDPRTGAPIPFPNGPLARVDKAERVEWNKATRDTFILEWERQGYPIPDGGWGKYHIHHILPKEFGGTNDFWNLVPVPVDQHNGPPPGAFTPWWNAYPG